MRELLLAAAGGAAAKLYSEDVFSAYPYTGTGAAQTITNGVDLTKGGLVWLKDRATANPHILIDTARGINNCIESQASSAEFAYTELTSLNVNGFSLAAPGSASNASGESYASWTFRRAAKFFDVVTYTGNGAASQVIPHALGIAPGMLTAKRRDSTGDWAVWHRSATGDLYLDTIAAQTASFTQITAASATTFSVSGNANISGAPYVAYVWAHDASATGIVQCGSLSYTGADVTVNLGWEPQYVLLKAIAGPASSNWVIADTARGFTGGPTASINLLVANSSGAESTGYGLAYITSTGFVVPSGNLASGYSYIYLAIRRGPMRTPTSGASVYNAIARTGTGAAASVTGVGFAPDMVMSQVRPGGFQSSVCDKLRGRSQTLYLSSVAAEPSASGTTTDVTSFDPNGVSLGTQANNAINGSGRVTIDWFFARAPGFLDAICYSGTGTNQTLAHNLGIAPKMVWVKDRAAANVWAVFHSALGAGQALALASSSAATDTTFLNNTAPVSSSFSVGASAKTNTSGDNYVAYLFGELAGVSKIGSYTGNGATQTINCGFASGARFVLIKRTDAAGDWLVLDTVRGIIVGNDPYLLLDSGAPAEVTTADLLTPQSVGFGLTSNALVNTSGGTYIYFAVA